MQAVAESQKHAAGETEVASSDFMNSEGIGKESEIYEQRFSVVAEETRSRVWKVLCRRFFQPFIPANATVVDIGAGDGHFIVNIEARRRIAVDLNPHSLKLRREGVEVLNVPATEFAQYLNEPVDVIFLSNFLEHLLNKRQVIEVLEHCFRALKPGGKIIVLQPNIRYVGAAYWDYIDHHVALTEKSLVETLKVCGFKMELVIPRFLPYTVNSAIGRIAGSGGEWLVRLYLRLPIFWRIFGQQTLAIGRKEQGSFPR